MGERFKTLSKTRKNMYGWGYTGLKCHFLFTFYIFKFHLLPILAYSDLQFRSAHLPVNSYVQLVR